MRLKMPPNRGELTLAAVDESLSSTTRNLYMALVAAPPGIEQVLPSSRVSEVYEYPERFGLIVATAVSRHSMNYTERWLSLLKQVINETNRRLQHGEPVMPADVPGYEVVEGAGEASPPHPDIGCLFVDGGPQDGAIQLLNKLETPHVFARKTNKKSYEPGLPPFAEYMLKLSDAIVRLHMRVADNS